MQESAEIYQPEWFDPALHWISLLIEGAGILVIVAGAAFAAATALARLAQGGNGREAYHLVRVNLARSILLGLELLVAADIIGTVAVEPTIENLSVLGLIVLIRTFLSISLEVEIDGRWPWRKAERKEGEPDSL
jgi:uncharacterized membrane protein